MVDTAVSNKFKAEVRGRDADNIIYLYKRIKHEPLANKIHILGLQGATSGTNTRTLQSTATKRANIKGVGSINQQRTVDVIFSAPEKNKKDLYWDLYAAWEKGELIGLWRMDLNTMHGTKPHRKIQAQFSQSLVPNLPNTEALGGTMTSNLQFEVNGMERAINSDENAFELDEEDLDDGILDDLAKFYNFSHGTDLGVDDNGDFVDNTVDDDTIEVQDTTTGEDVMGPAYKPVDDDAGSEKAPEEPQNVQSKATGTGADVSFS
ncbi:MULTISPECIES: hypothetical protein [Companilactobacillus]|uniref:hypothetical protein n=1 Tax=Companilactobacillus TaxID=2767879 RepID=UPI0024172DEA|nr:MULTISPECIES: hypothetical protein [Companilactobacillus]MDG5112688.1 hypothetical protein [Companilactobacillus pabuli]